MTRRSRTAQAVSTLVMTAVTVLLLAGPALAERVGPLENEDRGAGLSPIATIALFVLLPAAILVVVGALAWLPYLRGGPRYRPQRGWSAPALWFAGPTEPAQALADAPAAHDQRGGAHGTW